MKNEQMKIITMSAVAICLNIVLGILASSLKLPIYLDVIGTIFIAVYFGPFWGALVGGTTNLVTGIIFSPTAIPFMIVSIVIGITVGFIARKFGFGFVTALFTGLLLSVVAPLIGTPIGILLFEGLSGTGADLLFIWLKTTGSSVFASSFLTKITTNLGDKIGSCLLVAAMVQAIPESYLSIKRTNAKKVKVNSEFPSDPLN